MLLYEIRQSLRTAIRIWDSSNADAMNASMALLEQSLEKLQTCHEEIAAGRGRTPEARIVLLDIKKDIRRLLRVVDAASGFVAGVAGVGVDQGITYNAAGALEINDTVVEESAQCRIC